MSTLAITPLNDLSLPLAVVTNVGQEAAIRLRGRFGLFLGEWFQDRTVGTPWFQYVFIKNPDLAIVRRLFRKIILTSPGIASLEDIALSVDNSTRRLTFSFSATASDGSDITGGSDQPFQVSP